LHCCATIQRLHSSLVSFLCNCFKQFGWPGGTIPWKQPAMCRCFQPPSLVPIWFGIQSLWLKSEHASFDYYWYFMLLYDMFGCVICGSYVSHLIKLGSFCKLFWILDNSHLYILRHGYQHSVSKFPHSQPFRPSALPWHNSAHNLFKFYQHSELVKLDQNMHIIKLMFMPSQLIV